MTDPGDARPSESQDDSIGARIARLLQPILALPPVREGQRVLAAYDRVGGGLLSAGLAYTGLVAILPAVVLVVAIVGVVLRNPEREIDVISALSSYVPPLAGILEETLHQVSEGAIPVSIISLLFLIWGASRFYQALDTAFALIFQTPPRDIVGQTVRGLMAVGILLTAVILSVLLGAIASFFAESVLQAPGLLTPAAWRIVTPILASLVAIVAIGALYRWLPTRMPPWRAIGPPALVVGIGIALLTQVFAFIAPRLVGVAAFYGAIGALFAMLAWLSFMAQLVLLGAAWVHRREGPGAVDVVAQPTVAGAPPPPVAPGTTPPAAKPPA